MIVLQGLQGLSLPAFTTLLFCSQKSFVPDLNGENKWDLFFVIMTETFKD